MKQEHGDIWKFTYDKGNKVDAVCVLTNMTVSAKKLIMGGGQAREAREKFPFLPKEWGDYYGNWFNGQNLTCAFDTAQGFHVVAFPTKVHPSDDSTCELIQSSAKDLVGATDDFGWGHVVLPRPGCGLGGLKWERVEPVIADLFDDRFTVISNV